MDEPKLIMQLIPELYGLQVYTYQTAKEIISEAPPKEIYWRDTYFPQGFGPFPSIYTALTHYKQLTLDRKAENQNLTNLIQIDFRAKKRINPNH